MALVQAKRRCQPARYGGHYRAFCHARRRLPDTALVRSELENAGYSRVVIETRVEQSRASSPRLPGRCLLSGELSLVTKSGPETRENLKLQPTTPHPRLQTDMAVARLLPKFKHTLLWL